jgi:hypothetical protein
MIFYQRCSLVSNVMFQGGDGCEAKSPATGFANGLRTRLLNTAMAKFPLHTMGQKLSSA